MRRYILSTVVVCLSLALLGLPCPARAATITVTTASDAIASDGFVSLREAILAANSNAAVNEAPAGQPAPAIDDIRFAIGSGPQTISLTSALPALTESVILNATSQPGFTNQPIIELSGLSAGGNVNALTLQSAGIQVSGFVITSFSGDGIVLSASAANAILKTNWIGINLAGTEVLGNGGNGITLNNATGVQIGGTSAVERNVIAGNGGFGLIINGPTATGAIVQGNYIGADPTGLLIFGNGESGIAIIDAANNTIGGTAAGARNVIVGNAGSGVSLSGAASTNNTIAGNHIGVDVNGATVLGNASNGVLIDGGANGNTIGGTAAGARNVIAGNGSNGIRIQGSSTTSNQVIGNFIGVDISGTLVLGNLGSGISISAASGNTIGGTAAGARNVISGNGRDGVELVNFATNTVSGNFIGPDVTGAVVLGNGRHGVNITDADNNTIGGMAVGAGNVISGSAQHGVYIAGSGATGNLVQGNYIGTDAAGAVPMGNAFDGVRIDGAPGNTIGGTGAGARNVISGNTDHGVHILGGASGNLVQGNYIGVNATNTGPLGNGKTAVLIVSASNNTVGGTAAGAGNMIADNGGTGIEIASSGAGLASGNAVQGNTVLRN